MLKFDLFSVDVQNFVMGQLFDKSASDLYFSVTAQKNKRKDRKRNKITASTPFGRTTFSKNRCTQRVALI